MTCREKIRMEKPDLVGVKFVGGVCGCPEHHGYLPRPDYCPGTVTVHPAACTKCWDREIPEGK